MIDALNFSESWNFRDAAYAFASEDNRRAQDQLAVALRHIKISESERLPKKFTTPVLDEINDILSEQQAFRKIQYNIIYSHEPICSDLLRHLSHGQAVAYARIASMASNYSVVPKTYWAEPFEYLPEGGDILWMGPPNKWAFSVKVLQSSGKAQNSRNAGRKPKYNWQKIWSRYALHLGTNGIPENLGDAIMVIQNIASDENQGDGGPSASYVRDRLIADLPDIYSEIVKK